jgi:predicted DNA-binding transcriptional regulator AlpA
MRPTRLGGELNAETVSNLEGPSGDDRLLEPEDVAAMLRVPKSTLYAWRYRGEGPPSLRIGKHLRYKRQAILEWIDEQRDRRGVS